LLKNSAETMSTTLPLLDIALYKSNPKQFAKKLQLACHHIGFFLLQHDIPEAIMQEQLDETRSFFWQPLDHKLQILYENSSYFWGYMKLDIENTARKTDYREQIEYTIEYETSSGLSPHTLLQLPQGEEPVARVLPAIVEACYNGICAACMSHSRTTLRCHVIGSWPWQRCSNATFSKWWTRVSTLGS